MMHFLLQFLNKFHNFEWLLASLYNRSKNFLEHFHTIFTNISNFESSFGSPSIIYRLRSWYHNFQYLRFFSDCLFQNSRFWIGCFFWSVSNEKSPLHLCVNNYFGVNPEIGFWKFMLKLSWNFQFQIFCMTWGLTIICLKLSFRSFRGCWSRCTCCRW